MGRLRSYVELVRQSRLLAPNLKEMTLRLFTGNSHRGNAVARAVVRDHLLALRWSNPNAVVYLREARGQGAPSVEYELWKDGAAAPAAGAGAGAAADAGTGAAGLGVPATRARRLRRFEISHELLPEEVVAKVMMAARDPDEDDARRAPSAAPVPSATAGVAAAGETAGGGGAPGEARGEARGEAQRLR